MTDKRDALVEAVEGVLSLVEHHTVGLRQEPSVVALRDALRTRQKADEALLALPLAPWGIVLEWQEDGVDCIDWARHGHDNPDSSWASRRVSFDTEAAADEFIAMCGHGPIPVQLKPRRIPEPLQPGEWIVDTSKLPAGRGASILTPDHPAVTVVGPYRYCEQCSRPGMSVRHPVGAPHVVHKPAPTQEPVPEATDADWRHKPYDPIAEYRELSPALREEACFAILDALPGEGERHDALHKARMALISLWLPAPASPIEEQEDADIAAALIAAEEPDAVWGCLDCPVTGVGRESRDAHDCREPATETPKPAVDGQCDHGVNVLDMCGDVYNPDGDSMHRSPCVRAVGHLADHHDVAGLSWTAPETPIDREPVEKIARKLARDGCGDNHQPRHRVAGQSRFDDPNLCDHCGELADDIADALRAERERK